MNAGRTNSPVLVTGSHRSGTTWVGRMLCASPRFGYIHEPFNVNHSRGQFRADVPLWFTYICDDNAEMVDEALCDTVTFSFSTMERLRQAPRLGPKQMMKILWEWREFRLFKRERRRPLLKDPIAIFSAEWLARRFNMQVVAMIRHPAAFVSSLKKAEWPHPFDHFTRQPLFMRDMAGEFKGELEQFAAQDMNIVDQGCLLWNLIHETIRGYRDRHPDWIFIRHEDISRDPEGGFSDVFQALGESLSPEVRNVIRAHTSAENPSETEGKHEIRRDSSNLIHSWKKRLTDEEIARIREKTGSISAHFYTEDDW
ncbi:MAG: sulfotransferase [Nitrospirota bacterium]|nr:sulfotransferase [Nitrospirota bacterium]